MCVFQVILAYKSIVLCMCSGNSRIRRNLSIHIARFSASESPRATYQHSQNSPIFAGSKLIARGDALCARLRMCQHPKASLNLCSLSRYAVFIIAHAYFISSCLLFAFYAFIFTSCVLLLVCDHRGVFQ